MRAGALLVFFPLLFGCGKPSMEECEQLCRRFSELTYREQGDTPERRKAWKEMQDTPTFIKHLDNCVSSCRFEGGTREMAQCVADAQDAPTARACMAEEK